MFWLLVLGIAPLVLTSVLGHWVMTRTTLSAAGEQQLALATQAASDVNSRIRALVSGAAELCTASPAFQGEVAAAAGRPAEPALFWPADSARLTGFILRSTVSRELTRFQDDHPLLFEQIVVTARDGRVLGSTAALPSDVIPPDRRWFEAPTAVALSATGLNYLRDRNALEVVMPVLDTSGKRMVGLLRTRAGIDDLAQAVDGLRIGQTGFATLLSSTGQVVAGPRFARAAEGSLGPDRARHLTTGFPLWYHGSILGLEAAAVVALAPVRSTAGPGRLNLAGATWLVSVERTKAEVLAVPHRFGRTVVLVTLLTAALVLVIGMFMSERIVLPLRRLHDGARQIGAGRLDLKLELTTGDEIEELAREFEAMAAKLSESYRGLEDRVQQATAELARRNQSLQAILAALSEGLIVFGPDRRILLSNPAAEQMTGFASRELVGRPCAEALRPGTEGGPGVCDIAFPAGEPGPARTGVESSIITADGRSLPVGVSAAPLRDEAGRSAGCVVVLRDLTQEKGIERLKSDMVSIVSHELRTPLGPLIGFAELLQDPELAPEKRARYLRVIIEQGRRLAGLVENFLTLSQLEAGKFELHVEDTDLHRLADDVVAVEASHNPLHRLTNAIPPDLGRVRADPDRVRRVIHNLVSNAIKYSPKGGPVAVNARDLGTEVEVSVADQGMGIRREDLPRLFLRFQRMHRDDLPDVTGSGLGLSICKSIIAEHGGTIRVESRYGKGSTFSFSLPKQGPRV